MPKHNSSKIDPNAAQLSMDRLLSYKSPKADRVPNIPLYMDQVLSYLDTTLRPLETNPKEPCFTKTMINNYVKSGVLKPPIKKKYDQYHLMTLTMLYRLKKSLDLKDIEVVLGNIPRQRFEEYYQHFIGVEETVGGKLEVYSNGEASAEALWETIVTLAVEADAKMRLAEELVKIYHQNMTEKVEPDNEKE